jgi:asparagine synthase (glutamine-hydrolysing)
VGLGHRRLSIIDLAAGGQPLANEDRSVWIVFNGEIYNFRELRGELEARGHRFSTHSDTESIVHLYEEAGEACVPRLNGMFGFALWDERKERLLLARDRFGIKPLFYAWNGRRLLFGSEIKAILEAIPECGVDMEALHDYLSLNYIPGPRTIYQEVRKLQPGHLLMADGGGIQITRYWDGPVGGRTDRRRLRVSAEDAAAELLRLLRRAVPAQMVSDVPLGVFLSGGLDSSTVVALMSEVSERPVRTFSIGFEERTYSELPAARLVASRFHTDHTELIVRPEVRDLLPTLVRNFDEPFADSSAIPTYYVSQLARSRVTVALGGDGGDELFAGYDTYIATRLAGWYRRLPGLLRRWIIAPVVNRLPVSDAKVSFDYRAKRFVEGADQPPERAHFWWKLIFSEEAKRQLYRVGYDWPRRDSCQVYAERFQECPSEDLLDRLQYVDATIYLPDDILVKVDRMSMAHSLEVRVPLLDHDVSDFVMSLPPSLRLRGLTKKYILKRALKGILPPEILRRSKRGFNVPVARWLRRELRDLVADYLSPSTVKRQGYFDPLAVAELVRRHHSGGADYSRNLWGLLMFSMWHEQQRG